MKPNWWLLSASDVLTLIVVVSSCLSMAEKMYEEMKKLLWILALVLLCLSSCRDYRHHILENEIYLPEVREFSIFDIQEDCATLSFEVRETSELGVGQCGVLFSSSRFDNPKVAEGNIIGIDCGNGAGIHECKLPSLSPSTEYWICAYAKNDRQIVYSDVRSFTTTRPQASVKVNRAIITTPIYDFDFDKYIYDIAITFDLSGSSFSKVGVRVPEGNIIWSSETPVSTGLFKTTVLYSTNQTLSTLSLTPVVQTFDEREYNGAPYYFAVPGSGIKGNALLQLNFVDYYNIPGYQPFYNYGFRASVYLKSGVSLIKKFTTTLIFDGEFDEAELEEYKEGYIYYTDFFKTFDKPKLPQIMFSARAYYGVQSDEYVFFPGPLMEPSYEMAPNSSEIFYMENFKSATNSFTVEEVLLPEGFPSGWFWDSESNLMKANAYKDGVSYNSESWLISDEIDLSRRKSAVLQIQYAVRYMSNINEQARLKVSSDGGNSWEDLIIPDFANLEDNNTVYRTIDVSKYCGKKIRLAFVYKGKTDGSGYWWIDSVLFYEVIKTSSNSQNLNIKSNSQTIHRRPIVGHRSDELQIEPSFFIRESEARSDTSGSIY